MATMGFVRALPQQPNENFNKFTISESFSKSRLTSFGKQSITFAFIQELLGLKFLSCDVLAKRSQHANATCRNIVGRNMLRAFGHSVATCCDVLGWFFFFLLGVVGSNLTIFKLESTTPNISQHIATRWPNAHNMLRPTVLRRYVAFSCCDRLAGA